MRQTLTCVALFIGTAMTNGAKHQRDSRVRRRWSETRLGRGDV
jgi:hypothetical protein